MPLGGQVTCLGNPPTPPPLPAYLTYFTPSPCVIAAPLVLASFDHRPTGTQQATVEEIEPHTIIDDSDGHPGVPLDFPNAEPMATPTEPTMQLSLLPPAHLPALPAAPPTAPTTLLASPPVPREGNAQRPRGRAPVLRDHRGKSLHVACVWNGARYVAPGGFTQPPEVAHDPTRPTTQVVGTGTLPHSRPVTAPLQRPLPAGGALMRLFDEVGFREPLVPQAAFILQPSSIAARPVPAEITEIDRRLEDSTSVFGRFPDRSKLSKFEQVSQAMDEMGLSGMLRPDESPSWAAPPCPFEAELEKSLRQRSRERIQRSTEPESLLTALGWFRIHQAAFPNLIPFQPLTGGSGDMAASAYNERTIIRLGEIMRLYGSRRPGERGRTLAAGTIGGVLSTFRGLCTREAGYELELRTGRPGVKRVLKDMRREDGPRAVRRKREGFKAQHFQLAAEQGFDRTSRRGIRRWAVMHFCHNAVARGSSAGVSRPSDDFDPARGLTCTDVQLDLEKTGLPGLIADVFPGKDCERRHVKRPIPISSRPSGSWGGPGNDPRDAYLAIKAEYDYMLAEVPAPMRPTTPFFRKQGTVDPIATRDVACYVAEAREACGFIREDHELAHELRIGGASDIRDYFGSTDGKQLLIDRGRWMGGADIAFIYARTSAEAQYDTSARMGNANSRALEVVRPGWTQPGR